MTTTTHEPKPASSELVALAYELLDAGADTLELLDARTTSERWSSAATSLNREELHADYLRALQRRGREILAAETVTVGGQTVGGQQARRPTS